MLTREEKLEMALKWAFKNGASVDYDGDGFSDGGCGCCSGSLEPPEEFRDVVLEVAKQAYSK